ncbi:MAG: 4-hydroxythreonine-4-phosphate dehydrogenase PdxA [Pontixanthobacter sp.]
MVGSPPHPPMAVSIGDPAGIGPELIVQIWLNRMDAGDDVPPFFVIGGEDVLEQVCGAIRGHDRSCTATIDDPSEATAIFGDYLPIIPAMPCAYRPGQPDEEGAALALHSLAEATRFALRGQAAAIVTTPVAKGQLAKVGFEFPGQTEFLGTVCGVGPDDAVMMLAGPQLRTIPVTVHCALSEVAERLGTDAIVRKGMIAADALQRDFAIDKPRIAVTGLNPHAGEDGKFGREEADIIEPAIAALCDAGILATGPHPADALFAPHAREGYDVALCMYHDQALIPVKALDFDSGVNVTLGLPIIRTSPDHGTAFDIAGKGIARPDAMLAALRMASDCAARRRFHAAG